MTPQTDDIPKGKTYAPSGKPEAARRSVSIGWSEKLYTFTPSIVSGCARETRKSATSVMGVVSETNSFVVATFTSHLYPPFFDE